MAGVSPFAPGAMTRRARGSLCEAPWWRSLALCNWRQGLRERAEALAGSEREGSELERSQTDRRADCGSRDNSSCQHGDTVVFQCARPLTPMSAWDSLGRGAGRSLANTPPAPRHSVGAHVRFSPPASPHGSREFRSPSWPAIQSPLVRPLSAPQVWRGEARERLVQAVLSTMARQAALDGEVEDARALAISFATAESVFDAMDRLKRVRGVPHESLLNRSGSGVQRRPPKP